MTATDELRRMLDERGVEWEDCGNGATYVEHNGEAWRFDYDELFDQLAIVCLSGYTPEQAIAATLGDTDATPTRQGDAGTCHVEETERFECLDSRYKSFDYNPYITVHVMECSECGRTYEHVNGDYEYCPHCGRRKVVDE